MNHNRRRGRSIAVAVAATAALALAAACSGGADSGSTGTAASGSPDEPITITLQTFGGGKNFGYEEAVKKWNAANPNIQIKHTNLTDQFEQVYWPQMIQWLNAGSGAGDVIGIDEGGMGLAKAHPEWWTDLGEYGLDKRKDEFADWKWQNGIDGAGKLFGIGTDVGGMSICYRRDLFEKAGLPTDRDEVSKLWPTWDAFLETGQKFQEKVKDAKFVDGTNTVYNVMLVQEAAKNGNVTYFDTANELVVDSNPAVKTSFDYAVKLSQAGLTAKLRNFTDEWNTGFKKSQFATLGCPSWMLGVVSDQAGDEFKGKWDVAAVPGGGGNWGGSWLAVPKQSKHPKEAAQVLDYLTSKEVQVDVFNFAGNMPSNVQAQQDSAVQTAKDEYFNDAPKGEIFAKSAAALEPVYLGVKHAQVKSAIEQVIAAVDDGSVPADQAWQKLVADAKKAAD